MTNISEFRGKSNDELKEKTLDLKKELFNLRFQTAAGELNNTGRYRTVRRDIARLKTLMNEPEGAVKPKKVKAEKPETAKASKPIKDKTAKKAETKKKASGE